MYNFYATISTQIASLVVVVFVQGCSSPLNNGYITHIDPPLEESIIEEPYGPDTKLHNTITLPMTKKSEVEKSLLYRMEELEALVPSGGDGSRVSTAGLNLHQDPATTTPLTQKAAIYFAIENNLDVKTASLQPLITEQNTISAEAAFDIVFGASASSNQTKTPQQQIVLGGVPVNSSESITDTLSTSAELTKALYGGGTITLSTDIQKTNNGTPTSTVFPDPAWQTVGTLDYTQPLLRNFGESVTLAKVHTNKIKHNQSNEDVQDTLNQVVTQTERVYLDLLLQWRTLQVKEWLLEEGESIVEILDLRRSYDAGEADFAQAVATNQQRRADLISQQSILQKSSDTLKKLINTDKYPLQSEEIIFPTKTLVANPISISLRQAIMTALENRPDIQKLILDIQSESINVNVADNARMPQLDMQAQMSFYGLGDSAGEGYQEVFDTDYINYLAGLTFQIPLGNRSAEANYTSARLQKMSAEFAYKQGIQQTIIDVKNALRDIITNEELMRANRDFRIAQTENLRALTVEEETMGGLSPTFLNLKLQTQSGLAGARIAEFNSIISYNIAIADLYLAMGTTLQKHQIDVVPSTAQQ